MRDGPACGVSLSVAAPESAQKRQRREAGTSRNSYAAAVRRRDLAWIVSKLPKTNLFHCIRTSEAIRAVSDAYLELGAPRPPGMLVRLAKAGFSLAYGDLATGPLHACCGHEFEDHVLLEALRVYNRQADVTCGKHPIECAMDMGNYGLARKLLSFADDHPFFLRDCSVVWTMCRRGQCELVSRELTDYIYDWPTWQRFGERLYPFVVCQHAEATFLRARLNDIPTSDGGAVATRHFVSVYDAYRTARTSNPLASQRSDEPFHQHVHEAYTLEHMMCLIGAECPDAAGYYLSSLHGTTRRAARLALRGYANRLVQHLAEVLPLQDIPERVVGLLVPDQ